MARTWLELRSELFFLAPKIRISARKSVFSYGNLFFCTESRIAQVVTQILRPTDLVYDFSFPSYARFREGTRPMPQKVFPHPTVRAPSASNSPSALSARALRTLDNCHWTVTMIIGIYVHCWLIWCPVGGLAGGCGAGCISQDTYLLYPARALRALGLLLADGTPTGGRGEDFLNRQPNFFTETAVTPERKVEKSFPRWENNRHAEG